MRIVTWNCRGAFARKSEALFALKADLAIIQECSKKDSEALQLAGHNNLWFGPEDAKKGIAIFYEVLWKLSLLAPIDHTWIIPLEVCGPENFSLMAVWTVIEGGTQGYVKLLRDSLKLHPEWYSGGNVVMAGDFNSSCQWDKSPHYNHRSLVESLEEHGLASAYHLHYAAEHQGAELSKTFRSTRKLEYHIDYIFVPVTWKDRLQGCEAGTFDQWSKHSDHCPLIIDVVSQSSSMMSTPELVRHA
ncbi:endonuclease/exonuclease/phosphatase family protein [soil metagenome]